MQKNDRVCVFIVDGEAFPVEADRIEDASAEGLYKVYFKACLQGVFLKSEVQGYFWDIIRDCEHE